MMVNNTSFDISPPTIPRSSPSAARWAMPASTLQASPRTSGCCHGTARCDQGEKVYPPRNHRKTIGKP